MFGKLKEKLGKTVSKLAEKIYKKGEAKEVTPKKVEEEKPQIQMEKSEKKTFTWFFKA